MNTSQQVDITDEFISRLIRSTEGATARMTAEGTVSGVPAYAAIDFSPMPEDDTVPAYAAIDHHPVPDDGEVPAYS